MLMVANQSRPEFHWAAGAYPGRIGHLYSPAGKANYPWMPYALDNGAFVAFKNGTVWDEAAYLRLLSWAAGRVESPLWVLCPDVVGDRGATLARWAEWSPRLRAYGWPVAFAVQDGMGPGDVPSDADLIFVGGTTRWKWRTVRKWCQDFPRVHVGRVNGEPALWNCIEFGAESCDGTGWWCQARGRREQLLRFLERFAAGDRTVPSPQMRLPA
jgi:hypothetical protein